MKPFFSIWISPLKTFEYLSGRDDSKNRIRINILSILISIGLGIPQLKFFIDLFDKNKFFGLIYGMIFLSLLGLYVIKFFWTLIYWSISKILKGKATRNQVQLVVFYSFIPFLIYLVIGLIMIIPAVITKNIDLIFYRHPFTYYVVWVLTIRNLIYGLSYFNKFSYRYALLNVIISTGIFELIRQLLIYWKH